MLTYPTLEKLQALRLTGMVKGLEEQIQMTGLDELGFAERLGLLVDREMTERESRRLKDRLAKARLRHVAAVEDVDLRTPRAARASGRSPGRPRPRSALIWREMVLPAMGSLPCRQVLEGSLTARGGSLRRPTLRRQGRASGSAPRACRSEQVKPPDAVAVATRPSDTLVTTDS
jgi:hypothetical protein